MDCESHEPTLFENKEWRLSPSGLEHKANGYFIAADTIADRRSDGAWSWPAHLAEKLWYRRTSFEPAFAQALAAFGHRVDLRGTKDGILASGVTADDAGSDSGSRRLGEVVIAQLAPLGDQLAHHLEAGRRARRPMDGELPAPHLLRRAA